MAEEVRDINFDNSIDLALNQIKNVVVDVVNPETETVTVGRIISYQGDLYVGKALDGGNKYVKLGSSGSVEELEETVEGINTRLATVEGKYATKITTTGSGAKVTVNSEGLVESLSALAISDVTGLQTALNNKLDDSQLETSAITNDATKIPASSLVYAGLDGKVDKVSGKQLSTEDFTTAEKTKLAGIEDGADVNIIETVKVNNVALTPDASKAVNVAVPTKTSAITNDSGFITNAVNDLANYYKKSETYTQSEIDGMLTGAFHYKGTVATYADLPASPEVGDVYNIETADSTHGIKAGDNVAWNGTAWDVLSGTMDLSAYYTSAQVDGLLDDKVDKVAGYGLSQNDLTDALKATYDGKQDALTTAQLNAVNSGITSALVTKIGTNETAIATINSSDVMNSGITSAGVGQITTNKNDIAGIKTSAYATSGITSAKVDAYDAYADEIAGKMAKFDTAPTGGKVVLTVASDDDAVVEMTDTIGAIDKPVYVNAGVITESNKSLGNATTPVYMDAGLFKAGTAIGTAGYKSADDGTISSSSTDSQLPTSKTVYEALTSGVVTKVGTSTVGSASTPVYLNSGVPTAVTSIGASLLPFAVGESSVDTTANTDVTIAHGLGRKPKIVQVYLNDELVNCYVKVDATNITVNTSTARTGLRVCWMG